MSYFLNLIKANRSVAVMLSLFVLAAIAIYHAGCSSFQPRTLSPITNQPATASELAVQLEQWKATQASEAIARENALRTQLVQAQADAAAKVRAIREEAEATIARSAALTKIENDALAAEASRKVEQVAKQAQVVAEKVRGDLQAATAKIAIDTKAMDAALAGAEAELVRQAQQRDAIFAAVRPFAAAVPGGSAIVDLLPLVLGGGAAGIGLLQAARKGKEATDAKQAEAQAKQSEHEANVQAGQYLKQKAEIEEAAKWVVASIDVLKEKRPEVAAAFKESSKLLEEWQGEAGTALVSRLQK